MRRPISLSKSQYLVGCQCPKALWLLKHAKHLKAPISPETQRLFDQGRMVETWAHQLYPKGLMIESSWSFSEKIERSRQAIQSGAPAIYEAFIQAPSGMCMVDILVKQDDGWELVEVKSSTRDKAVHVTDISYQYAVCIAAGLPIKKVTLLHLNTRYHRGKDVDPKELFTHVDLSETVLEHQEEIRTKVQGLQQTVAMPQEPDMPIGLQCQQPYDCDFMGHCWKNIPDYSVFNIVGVPLDEKFRLYYEGYVHPKDVPTDEVKGPSKIQILAEQSQSVQINKEKLSTFLEGLEYPLVCLDFETMQSPVPPFPKTSPYQQIPFQYSMHTLNSPFDSPSHSGFLGEAGTDPRLPLIKQMIKDIPENACILVYNQKFEQSILQDLIKDFPKYAIDLQRIHDSIQDLMIPFQEKWYYHPQMKGRYSIKVVLPSLVPGYSYSDLDIQDGLQASLEYQALPQETDSARIATIRDQLIAYCELDTYAMIEILEKLREQVFTSIR